MDSLFFGVTFITSLTSFRIASTACDMVKRLVERLSKPHPEYFMFLKDFVTFSLVPRTLIQKCNPA